MSFGITTWQRWPTRPTDSRTEVVVFVPMSFRLSDCLTGSDGFAVCPKAWLFFSTYDERTDMNGDSPATKNDLEQLRSVVKQDLEQLHSEVKQDLAQHRSEVKQELEQMRSEANHMHDDLVERIRDGETRLLQAFYSFADSNNKRLVQREVQRHSLEISPRARRTASLCV